MKIENLLVNRRAEPMGISWDSARFSFVADEVGVFHASLYREDDAEPCAERDVSTDEASGFSFYGALAPETRYRYRVNAGEASAETVFETGSSEKPPFLTPADRSVRHPVFEKSFRAKQTVRARLYLTGLGLYRAFLNGARVGEEYLTPGCNDYHAYLRVQTYDVTDLLREGENTLRVFVGCGWYSGRYGIDKPIDRGDRVFGEFPLLAAALIMTDADGKRTAVRTDRTWIVYPSGCVSDSIYDGEVWELPAPAKPVGCRTVATDFPRVPDDSSPIRAVTVLTPRRIRSEKGEYLLDFGQNFAGFVRFRATLPRGTRVRLLHGEVLQDGCFYRDNLRTARAEAVYVSDGGERTYEPMFSYFGFRYVSVEGIDDPDAVEFEGVVLSTDLRRTGFCETSDPALNRLLENVRYGQLSNFMDIPTDCPQRDERLGWTADTQVFSRTALYFADCQPFYRKHLGDLRADQVRYYHGDLPMYSPSLSGEAGAGGAGWSDCAAVLPWNLYQTYGDLSLLEESYLLMRDYAETLSGKIGASKAGGLITEGFTFGDWLASDGVSEQSMRGGTDDGFIRNAYACHSLDLTVRAAVALGKRADADRFGKALYLLKNAFLDAYFTKTGRIAVPTQTAAILSLAFGLYREREPVCRALRESFRKAFYRLQTGFLGTPLALPVLFACGMDDIAYRVLFNRECPGWLYAVGLGATTVWERWNSLLPDGKISGTQMNSLNHYAYGSVAEAIFGDIAGLRPAVAGWGKAAICPHPNGRLRKIAAVYESPRGMYRSGWEILPDGQVRLEITVPAGCEADLCYRDANLSMRLTAGDHTLLTRPVKDYLHPFDQNSILLDLTDSPDALALMRRYLPQAYAIVMGENREFLLETPAFLASLPMFGTTDDAMRSFLAELRRVHV